MPFLDPVALDPVGPDPVAGRIAEWRAAEDKLFRSVMADPELYMAAIRFVRATADELADVTGLDELVGRFEQGQASDLGPIAERLNVPKLVLLDYSLARGAAFYLRARQLKEAKIAAASAARLAEARQRNEVWVTLWNHEQSQNGHVFFDRLEVHVTDGVGLHLTHGLDLEAGWVYSLEPLLIDVETGAVITTDESRGRRLDFATREELDAELGRRKSELTASGGVG